MTENKRSNWLKSLVAMRVLEAIVALISVDIISAIIHLFVADRLWNKSKFWRNVTAYLGVPLGLVLGLWWISQEDIVGGAGIIVENIIIGILYIMSWNEFVPEKKEEEWIRTSIPPLTKDESMVIKDLNDKRFHKQNDLEEETLVQEGKELSGKTVNELDPEKNEIVSRLDELKKEYASGSMVDEEYEELRNSYQEKLRNINRRMKQ